MIEPLLLLNGLNRSYYVWVIDQVCSVKMAGYWPSSFWEFMDRDEVEVH